MSFPAELLDHMRYQRLILDQTFVSSAALFIYDHALTFRREIKFVWHSPWTYTKVLFLLIRYTAFVGASLFTINQTFLGMSAESCKMTWSVVSWILIVQSTSSFAVLSIRTWAVWRRERAIGIALAVLMVASLVLECIITNEFVNSVKFGPPPFPEYRGCVVVKAVPILWELYTVMAVDQAVVLTLVVISAFQSYRLGRAGELSHVVYRDGILFYVCILCLTIVNVVTTIIFPVDLMVLFTPPLHMLYAVFTTRVVLNIREAGNRGSETELHTSYCDSLVFATPDLPLTHDDISKASQDNTDGLSQP